MAEGKVGMITGGDDPVSVEQLAKDYNVASILLIWLLEREGKQVNIPLAEWEKLAAKYDNLEVSWMHRFSDVEQQVQLRVARGEMQIGDVVPEEKVN